MSSYLFFTPSNAALKALEEAWAWLVPPTFRPVRFGVLAAVFYEADDGVHWLDLGEGTLTRVAKSLSDFERKLGTKAAADWLLPHVVDELRAEGKIPGPGECYWFTYAPILEEGSYEIENIHPVPAKEAFGLSGSLHQQLSEQADED